MDSRSLHAWGLAWDGSRLRGIDDGGRHRDSTKAHRGFCTWSPYNVEHDALTSIFYRVHQRGRNSWCAGVYQYIELG